MLRCVTSKKKMAVKETGSDRPAQQASLRVCSAGERYAREWKEKNNNTCRHAIATFFPPKIHPATNEQ